MRKLTCLLMVATILLATGCMGQTEEVAKQPVSSTYQAIEPSSEPVQTAEPTKEAVDYASIVEGNLEKNFEKAMQHVKICGREVSFPLTMEKLGEDFSYEAKKTQLTCTAQLRAVLLYKGKKIADIDIQNGQKVKKDEIRNCNISCLEFNSLKYPDSEFEICGIGIHSIFDDVQKVFGPCTDRIFGPAYYNNGDTKSLATKCIEFIDHSKGNIEVVLIYYYVGKYVE